MRTANKRHCLILWAALAALPALLLAQGTSKALDHLAKAEKHLALGKLDKMLKQAEKARNIDPSLGESYALLGIYYYRNSDFEIARSFFETSIDKDPNISRPHAYLGNLLFEEGNSDRALDEWSLSARLDPQNPEALASLAIGFFRLGKKKEALQHYKKALRWDKRYYDEKHLADFRGGAGWGAKKLEAAVDLLKLIPAPRIRY